MILILILYLLPLQNCQSYEYYFPLCGIKASINNFRHSGFKSSITLNTQKLQLYRSVTSISKGHSSYEVILDDSLNVWQEQTKKWLSWYSNQFFDDNLCTTYSGIAHRSGWCWPFEYWRVGDSPVLHYLAKERANIKVFDHIEQPTNRTDQCFVFYNNRQVAFINWTPLLPVAYPDKLIFSVYMHPSLEDGERIFIQKAVKEKMQHFLQYKESIDPSAIYQLYHSKKTISLNAPALHVLFNTYYKEKLFSGTRTKLEIEESSFSLEDLLKIPNAQYGNYKIKKIKENRTAFLRQFLSLHHQFNFESDGIRYWNKNLNDIIYDMEHPDESSFYDVYGIFDQSSMLAGGTVIKRKNHLIDHDIIACTISKKEQSLRVFDNFAYDNDTLHNKVILWKLYTHIIEKHPTLVPDFQRDYLTWQFPTRHIAIRDFFALIYRKTQI
jgi:hypothetical protein